MPKVKGPDGRPIAMPFMSYTVTATVFEHGEEKTASESVMIGQHAKLIQSENYPLSLLGAIIVEKFSVTVNGEQLPIGTNIVTVMHEGEPKDIEVKVLSRIIP